MPRRTKQHHLGDRGLYEVMSICTRYGWICDKNSSDYGEDIIAQTAHGGIVEPFRIFIQVKTTQRLPFGTGDRVVRRFLKSHIVKWIRSPDLVIIVIWDVSSSVGYLALPYFQYDEFTLVNTNKKYILLAFTKLNKLDDDALLFIEWTARTRNFNRYLLEVRSKVNSAYFIQFGTDDMNDHAFVDKQRHDYESSMVSVAFLEALGLISVNQNGKITHNDCLADTYYLVLCKLGHTVEKLQQFELMIVVILTRMNMIREGVAIPGDLLDASARLLEAIVKAIKKYGSSVDDHLVVCEKCMAELKSRFPGLQFELVG